MWQDTPPIAIGGSICHPRKSRGRRILHHCGSCAHRNCSGCIKPCVSANVGDQFTAKNSHLVGKVFQIFYFIINFGSFFASILTPWFYKRFGPEVAFGVPVFSWPLPPFVFWLGRKKFVKVPPSPGGKLGRIDFFASTFLIVPLLLGVFVLLEESEKVVHACYRWRVRRTLSRARKYCRTLVVGSSDWNRCSGCGFWTRTQKTTDQRGQWVFSRDVFLVEKPQKPPGRRKLLGTSHPSLRRGSGIRTSCSATNHGRFLHDQRILGVV